MGFFEDLLGVLGSVGEGIVEFGIGAADPGAVIRAEQQAAMQKQKEQAAKEERQLRRSFAENLVKASDPELAERPGFLDQLGQFAPAQQQTIIKAFKAQKRKPLEEARKKREEARAEQRFQFAKAAEERARVKFQRQQVTKEEQQKAEEESIADLRSLGKELRGNARLKFQAAIKRKDFDKAISVFDKAQAKPNTLPGIVQASRRGEVNILDEESRKQYWKTVTKKSSEAKALEERFKKQFINVPEDKRSFWQRWFGGGEAPKAMVRIRFPDGSTADIPKERAEEAIKAGATLVPLG